MRLLMLPGRKTSKSAWGKKEIYIQYGSGMGRSKLQIPAAKTGTARNMNTVAKLAEMATKLRVTLCHSAYAGGGAMSPFRLGIRWTWT